MYVTHIDSKYKQKLILSLQENNTLKNRLLSWQQNPGRKLSKNQLQNIDYLNSITKQIPSLQLNSDTNTSVHTLVDHNSVGLYLLSINSLYKNLHLRCKPSVVMYDDGTLTAEDINFTKSKLKNIVVISKMKLNKIVTEKFGKFKSINKFYNEKLPNGRQYNRKLLIPFINYLYSKKIILLDSDTIFYKEPTQITDWINNRTKFDTLFNIEDFSIKTKYYEKGDFPWRYSGTKLVGIYDTLELEKLSTLFGRKVRFAPELNSGLIATYPNLYKIEVLEKLLTSISFLGYAPQTPRYDLMEQTIFSLLVGTFTKYAGLPKKQYVCTSRKITYNADHIYHHFIGKSKFDSYYIQAISEIKSELNNT